MSERTAAVVHDWLTHFHNKDYTAAERIDKLVLAIEELIDERVEQALNKYRN